ncbi:MAG: HpcH/HpaI aldolase/citrate lyase family protein [Halobacteriaceae archaeon]
MQDPPLRERLEAGETVVGTFQTVRSPAVAELLGQAGMDFVIFDQEHGPLTASDTMPLVMGAESGGAGGVVRVRKNEGPEIQRALDIGADAVQIPQIETVEDARDAAGYARFDPIGERGLSPYVRAGGYTGSDTYTTDQNESVTVIVHIEGEAGVENLDDVVSVEGIDVLFLGPYDLSQSLGIPGQVGDERVESLMSEVCDRAAEAGRLVGTYADDPEMARRWIDAGADYVAVSVGTTILKHAAKDVVAEVEA